MKKFSGPPDLIGSEFTRAREHIEPAEASSSGLLIQIVLVFAAGIAIGVVVSHFL